MPTLPNSEITVTGNGTVHIVHTGELHLHFNLNGDDRVLAKLGQIDANTIAISGALKLMSPQLQALTTEVTRANTVSASAVALIQGLAKQIEDNKDDPEALQALADSLKKSDDAIATAVTANTPSTGGTNGPQGDTGTGAIGADPV